MNKRLSFRQKIVLSQIGLFLLLILLCLPFLNQAVDKVFSTSLNRSAKEIVVHIRGEASENKMIYELKRTQGDVFYGLALYDSEGKVLYNSDFDFLSKEDKQLLLQEEPEEVMRSLKSGSQFIVRESPVYHKLFSYVTIPFTFNKERYVLRGSFPYQPIKKFKDTFNYWFAGFCLLGLITFSVSTWLIFGRLHKPIYQIIRAIHAYKEGKEEQFPQMLNDSVFSKDEEFSRLADTLLSLYRQVQENISSLIDERNEKEAILESLGEGVIAVDGDMKVTYVNFVGSKMLGIPRRHLLEKPFPIPNEKPQVQLFQKSKDLLVSCQRHRAILTDSLTIEQGTKVYLDLVAAPKSQGHGAIIVLQDKSSQSKVLEMGKDFVANASHELRTPITIIRGFAETLQDMQEIPHEMLSDIIEKIVRNCERMDSLVKNLLTLADIENLSISPFQSCDLITLVDNCRQIVQAVYPDAIITVEKQQEEITAAADANIFELAVINLLTNAAKYSKPPAHIHVKIRQAGDEAELVISDRGMGIPPQDVEHIFERFYTVNKAHSRKLGGAGLGLSLVKTIIDKHQGTISVESKLGEGTTFRILVPLAHFH